MDAPRPPHVIHVGVEVSLLAFAEACRMYLDIPGGVGIVVNRTGGQVELLFDARQVTTGLSQKIHDEIVQDYVALAVAACMKDLGYRVTEEPSEASVVRLLGVT